MTFVRVLYMRAAAYVIMIIIVCLKSIFWEFVNN